MSEQTREEREQAVRAAILALNEQKLPTRAIAAHSTVEPDLTYLVPLPRCKEIAHEGYVRAVIQAIERPDGTREFQSVVQLRFDEATGEQVEEVIYERAEEVREDPEKQRKALQKARRMILGGVRRLAILDDDFKTVILATIEAAFDAMSRRLKDDSEAA